MTTTNAMTPELRAELTELQRLLGNVPIGHRTVHAVVHDLLRIHTAPAPVRSRYPGMENLGLSLLRLHAAILSGSLDTYNAMQAVRSLSFDCRIDCLYPHTYVSANTTYPDYATCTFWYKDLTLQRKEDKADCAVRVTLHDAAMSWFLPDAFDGNILFEDLYLFLEALDTVKDQSSYKALKDKRPDDMVVWVNDDTFTLKYDGVTHDVPLTKAKGNPYKRAARGMSTKLKALYGITW